MRTLLFANSPQDSALGYMMCQEVARGRTFGKLLFLLKTTWKGVDVPRWPMISHLYPWASTSVLGGTRWCYRARPLPDVYGGALGEASGTVYFHFREQGRPQRASFSAGDLSLLPRDSSSSQFGYRLSFGQTAGARMHRKRPHGRDARAHRDLGAILRRIREFVAPLCRGAAIDDGWRRPRHPNGKTQAIRANHQRCRVCRARCDVSDVGSGALRGA